MAQLGVDMPLAPHLRLISLISRRHDLSLERFSTHWRTVHRALALALQPVGIMRGYVQNHRREIEIPGLAVPGDGAPELWVDSVEALEELGRSPAYLQGAALDEPNFMAGAARGFVGQAIERAEDDDRHAVVGATKLLLFYTGVPGISRERLIEIWRDRGLTLSRSEAVRRAELYVGADPDGAGSVHCAEAIWWPDDGDFQAAWDGRENSMAREIDHASLLGMLVEELPVLWLDGSIVE